MKKIMRNEFRIESENLIIDKISNKNLRKYLDDILSKSEKKGKLRIFNNGIFFYPQKETSFNVYNNDSLIIKIFDSKSIYYSQEKESGINIKFNEMILIADEYTFIDYKKNLIEYNKIKLAKGDYLFNYSVKNMELISGEN